MSAPIYARRAFAALLLTMAAYLLMNGAQIFETLVIVPAWTAAPPASLTMFHGEHGLDFKAFWIGMHSLHELTFLAAIVLCWKLPRVRRWLLASFAVHFLVRVWTLAYFAPTIIALQALPPSTEVDAALVAQAAQWRTLNDVRVFLFIAVNVTLIPPTVWVGRMVSGSERAPA